MSAQTQNDSSRTIRYFYIRDARRRPVATVAYTLDRSEGDSRAVATYAVATCAMSGDYGRIHDFPAKGRGRAIAASRLELGDRDAGARSVRFSLSQENPMVAILKTIAHAPAGIFPTRAQDLARAQCYGA